MFTTATGQDGQQNHVNGILTTAAAETASPDLLQNEVDDRIVKMRPMSTPVDQISRYARVRHAGSMVVEYYGVDTRATSAVTAEAVSARTGITSRVNAEVTVSVDDASAFDATDTVMARVGDSTLDFYVLERTSASSLRLLCVAPAEDASGNFSTPAIPAGTRLIRMGRAAGELDVQTPQFEALPVKKTNYCQIFKAQIEQSAMFKACNKEAGFTLSDQEEIALFDMRLGMEKSFIFGRPARILDPLKKTEIFLTGGIWHQAGRQFEMNLSRADNSTLIDLCKCAFEKSNGSSRKILLAGSEFINYISKIGDQQHVLVNENVVTKWGLDFHEIKSKFGTLMVILCETFDACGHEKDAMVIDPEYLVKYVHVPFAAEPLDLRTSGQRNSEAIVLTEAACLVLRYPDAHVKVIGK